MRNRILAFSAAIVAAMGLFQAGAEKIEDARDTLTIREAFLQLPVKVMDILPARTRMDMMDFYDADSIPQVKNAMEGFSQIERPVTSDYMRVRLTDVTEVTLKILPGRKGSVLGVVYSVGPEMGVTDSEITFYSEDMKELKRDKLLKIASTEDFLNIDHKERKLKKEILEAIPFPSVEYSFSPDGTELTARLTTPAAMGLEQRDKVVPYLHDKVTYHWTGEKYERDKHK